MINKSKWLESLPKNNLYNVEIDQLDHDRWVNTIPKSNTYNSIKKYSFAAILFVLVAGFIWLKGEMKIDSCLDNGGRWDYENKTCEYS